MRQVRERGAILVEFALIIPVLMILAFGIFEMGMAWQDRIVSAQAVRQGVRTITHLGNEPTIAVDQEGLLALRASMFNQWDDVEFVVIYRADVNGDMESDLCLTASSVPNHCNYYPKSALDELDDNASPYWSDTHTIVKWDWDARDNALSSADHVGVYVRVNHQWESGFFPGDGVAIGVDAVMRMEPS